MSGSRERFFGELRSVLSRGESKEVWDELCQVIDRFSDVELDQMIFPYVEGSVRSWQAEVCQAPREWVKRALAHFHQSNACSDVPDNKGFT